ncbi:hypothetical protein [Singulisphaera acidiphila]|uniref:Uncharacterized protein n=1 Tax=Singulisphaera acidiphila (strain ATCC BAA-1392 / DSM 18658 / VKM B-2454 / MOB10) TaxID=886293 RepID=L0D987_SINAD|nr:hypothetical protein [Singulisphaera acidiphila]AGA25812.1 hypothetical protein Sinac_1430 [Singulisphaera acidiphila DSM 18658]
MSLAAEESQSATSEAFLADALFGIQAKSKVSERAARASKARHASKRRQRIDPTTCEREYTAAELEFMQAIQAYKQSSGRMFPTWSEILEVLQGLGYEKLA